MKTVRFVRLGLAAWLIAGLLAGSIRPAAAATQIDIHGPAGSGQFGDITLLPNGNIVVVDYKYDLGSIPDVGAVYLYDGATGAQISMLTGSSANDHVGRYGVTVLANGNYVIESPTWDNGAIADAGAVTWGSAATGVSGVISAANSLVGSTAGDQVGCMSGDPGICWTGDIDSLSNGNYVVVSPQWHNGAAADAGAVTWGDGTKGVTGVVSAGNSLVGSTAGDRVGCYYGGSDYCSQSDVTQLSNGNYLVRSPFWRLGATKDVGAVTWANGTTGVKGVVSAANSLVGGTENDYIGFRVATLTGNSNYLVYGTEWDNGPEASAGAVTWGSGSTGVKGPVSAANSLVGSVADDGVGFEVFPLTNGNYVVTSYYWHNGSAAGAGSVTWGNGLTGISGPVSAANSLVGAQTGDSVGWDVTPLVNGNYVVGSWLWDNGAVKDVGAVTWGNGNTGISGPVTAANSLVGSQANDQVSFRGITALANGNYVVTSYFWHNGAVAGAGAVTWGDGDGGTVGPVSAANSLVGSTEDDWAGRYQFLNSEGVTPLSNGNYVVRSSYWDNGATANVGAVTWGNGDSGTKGVISPANSLVGSAANDSIGYHNVTPLSNGNYLVTSLSWDNAGAANAGAVTWGSGMTGIKGVISPANSLVGSTADDRVGCAGYSSGECSVWGIDLLSNGNYVVRSPDWDNGAFADAGAVTWGSGTGGVKGVISAANSLVGGAANDQVGYHPVDQLSNGNYVASSIFWDNGSIANAGAVTWGVGTGGVKGLVSPANSLVGSAAGDQVGSGEVLALSSGNYVVRSFSWDNGAVEDAGAVTWADGAAGITGVISSTNSLVGSTAGDQVAYRLLELSNGRYLAWSRMWHNGGLADAGAVTWSPESGGVTGPITSENSVLGTAANNYMVYDYDPVNNQIVVGRYADNIVTLVRLAPAEADLQVSKSATPDPVTIGDLLTYTITVSNGGPAAATGVTLTDHLPAGVSYVSDDAGCQQAGGTVTCSLGAIASGSEKTVRIVARVQTTGVLNNTASATADQPDPSPDNTSDTATTQAVHRRIYMPLIVKKDG